MSSARDDAIVELEVGFLKSENINRISIAEHCTVQSAAHCTNTVLIALRDLNTRDLKGFRVWFMYYVLYDYFLLSPFI